MRRVLLLLGLLRLATPQVVVRVRAANACLLLNSNHWSRLCFPNAAHVTFLRCVFHRLVFEVRDT